jgi:hypothetical protein
MIQWNKEFSEWTIISSDTSYAFYYVTFYDGITESPASDYVPSTGLAYNTAKKLAEQGLNHVKAEVDGDLITWDWLLDRVNAWQEAVTSYVTDDGISKDWTFEIVEDLTSIAATQNENQYAVSGYSTALKYPDTDQGIIGMKFGPDDMDYVDHDIMEGYYNGVKRTELATGASAADTSIVLDDTYEISESGSGYLGEDLITFTANSESTSTLSGIPASGTGSVTDTRAVDTVFWQGVKPGKPTEYTIFNSNVILNLPVSSSYVGYKIKARYYGVIARLTSLSEVTPITITRTAKLFLGAEIEARKKNLENSAKLMAEFFNELEKEAQKDMSQVAEADTYYKFNY